MAKDSEKSVGGGLMGILQPLLGKVKSVNPQAAKTSATRSATGTKDLVQMSIAYLKQETQAPLKGIAKYVSFGLAAALFFSTGSVLLMLGLLRGMQSAWAYERADERGPLSGSLSWLPYALSALACVLIIGLLALAWSRPSRRRMANNRNVVTGGSK